MDKLINVLKSLNLEQKHIDFFEDFCNSLPVEEVDAKADLINKLTQFVEELSKVKGKDHAKEFIERYVKSVDQQIMGNENEKKASVEGFFDFLEKNS